MDKELDSVTSSKIFFGIGLTNSANTSLFYLPQWDGGLPPSLLYQVSRHCQLLTFSDPTVRLIAERKPCIRSVEKEKQTPPCSDGLPSNARGSLMPKEVGLTG